MTLRQTIAVGGGGPDRLNPGEFWHLVSIIRRVLVDLPNGGQEEIEEAIVSDEPAQLTPLTGTERELPSAIVATATHRIRLYWIAGIRPEQKVTCVDPAEGVTRTFEILSVQNPDGRAFQLDLIVIEQV